MTLTKEHDNFFVLRSVKLNKWTTFYLLLDSQLTQ